MNSKRNKIIITVLVFLLVVLGVKNYKLDNNGCGEEEIVTVTGEATLQEMNKLARFMVSIEGKNENKDEAVKDLEERSAKIIKVIKGFGIEEKDIETESMNVYQESIWDDGERKEGDWKASTSISLVLREINKSSELTSLLNSNDVERVSGPNFYIDEDDEENDEKLFEMAIENARDKAELLAKSAGRRLGKVVKISEGSENQTNVYTKAMGGALELSTDSSMPVEVGSSKLSKSVIVVFELK